MYAVELEAGAVVTTGRSGLHSFAVRNRLALHPVWCSQDCAREVTAKCAYVNLKKQSGMLFSRV